jgi:hypothetical protein
MPCRWLLVVALVFVAGLAGGVSLDRYALNVPAASIPAATPTIKPTIREQILGHWEGVAKDEKVAVEVGSDDTITFNFSDGKAESVSFRWLDDEHILLGAKGKETWLEIVVRDDTLTLKGGEEILRLKRAANKGKHRE